MMGFRRWLTRGLDLLAVAVLLFAIIRFGVLPRLETHRVLPAPAVSLVDLNGKHDELASHRGRMVFLDFWASWCEPCRQSIPLVQRFARLHPEVDVLSVDVGEPAPAVRAFAAHHPMATIALDADETVAHAFGVVNYPTLVAIDPQGNERGKWVGFDPQIERSMADVVGRYATSKQASIFGASIAQATTTTRTTPSFAIEDEPNSLNTIRNTPFGWELAPVTQGYLFLVDDRGELVPDRALAVPTVANGGISADRRTITYHIRTGRWSDGAPFDARDVAFTIEALRNPHTAVPDTTAVAPIVSYEVPHPDTLIVHLREPSAPFVASFLTLGANDPFAILPRHIAARYTSLDRSSLDTQPVGLGPFVLERWERGSHLRFVRNPYYWRGPATSPRIDVAIVPSPQTRLVLARSGEIDALKVDGVGVEVARTIANMPLISRTTNVVDYLQFNLHSAALRDRRARAAITAAIDRERLARTVYHGTLEPADTFQLDPRYRGSVPYPQFSPGPASISLPELELAIASDWRDSANVAVQIAADLAAAGIHVRIRPYTEAQFWGPKDAGGILESGHYDLALTSWNPALDPDRSYLFGCAAIPPGGGNSMFYCDPAYDAAEAEGARHYEPSARAPSYRIAADLLARALPALPLGFERRTYALSTRLHGFRPNPLGRDYWNAWELGLAATSSR